MLVNSSAFAAPPLNEKIIQYRYYIKILTQMPEFKDDLTLPLENDFTKILLDTEIDKTYENYNEVLNYIDSKCTTEIVIYDEFLKHLKEKLASKGIFPPKFDQIHINSSYIYTPIFDLFSMESSNVLEYKTIIPENVQKTKRIFPYLYSKYFFTKDIKAINKLLEDFKAKEEDEHDSAYYYNEANKLLIRAYSSYCDENYPLSCTSFRDCIPYWQKYYELANMQKDLIDYLIGVIKQLQGLSAIEFDYKLAKDIFKDSIDNFYGNFASVAFYSHCFIAETYYRQHDIKNFIDYMSSINVKKPQREGTAYSYYSIVAGSQIMQFEYDRLSRPFVYSTPEDSEKRKNIADLMAQAEGQLPNDCEGAYVRKTFVRYKEIMTKNSLEIKAIGFDHYSTTTKHYIKLKKHDDDQVIQTPQWLVKTNPNDNTVKLEIQPIAAVRNEKIRIQVIIGAQGTPADIIGEYKLTGYDTINKIGFNIVTVKKNKSNLLIECESDKEISKTVGIYLLDIKWHLIKQERKENSSIIKDFYLGNTQHTIYIMRKYIEEACYWKIVEHTCDWMKNLSESDLDDDDKIVDAIWQGCSIENLSKLGYWYKWPNNDGNTKTLGELLTRKYSACQRWSEFLIHCLYCQGIKSDHLSIWYGETYETKDYIFYQKYNGIGIVRPDNGHPIKPEFFPDHSVVGYKGKYDSQSMSYYGLILDTVFHIRSLNTVQEPYVYEDDAIEMFRKQETSNPPTYTYEPKKQKKKQINIKKENVK